MASRTSTAKIVAGAKRASGSKDDAEQSRGRQVTERAELPRWHPAVRRASNGQAGAEQPGVRTIKGGREDTKQLGATISYGEHSLVREVAEWPEEFI